MTLPLRPMSPEDVDDLLVLAQAVAEADAAESIPTREWIEAQFTMPGIDITRTAWVLPGPRGGVRATVSSIPLANDDAETIHISMDVHPHFRREGLEEALLRHAEERGAAARTRPELPGMFHVGVQAGQTDRAAMLEQMGYHAVRWFLKLSMDLGSAAPPRPVPEGFTFSSVNRDLSEVFLVLDESFRDHWNQAPLTLEQFDHLMAVARRAPTLVLLARAVDGSPAGACITRVTAERNEQRGVREGEIAMLGVRRPYRKQGLGQALLAKSVDWLRLQGMTVATIDVDADSRTGAQRLYAAVGFTEQRRSAVYHKAIA